MKQFFLLILMLILVVSCKKERVVEHQSVAGFQVKTKPVVVLNTDTIYFSYTADDKEPEEYAIIKLVEQKFTKDSLSNSKFRIEFIQKSKSLF